MNTQKLLFGVNFKAGSTAVGGVTVGATGVVRATEERVTAERVTAERMTADNVLVEQVAVGELFSYFLLSQKSDLCKDSGFDYTYGVRIEERRSDLRQAPYRLTGRTPGLASGKMSGWTPNITSGKTPGRTPSMTSGKTPGRTPSMASGLTPGLTSGKTPGRTPGLVSDKTSGWTSNMAFDRMQARAYEIRDICPVKEDVVDFIRMLKDNQVTGVTLYDVTYDWVSER